MNNNHCLAGTKVTIFDDDHRLGSGILITYKKIQNEDMVRATLLTPYGEKQFSSKKLTITPTENRFKDHIRYFTKLLFLLNTLIIVHISGRK